MEKSDFDNGIYEGFDDLAGREVVKFAVAVAVAGRHNFLVFGNPNRPKIARLMRYLQPKLLKNEIEEVKQTYIDVGEEMSDSFARPFRFYTEKKRLEREVVLADKGILYFENGEDFSKKTFYKLKDLSENNFQLVIDTSCCNGRCNKTCKRFYKKTKTFWAKFSRYWLDRIAIRIDFYNDKQYFTAAKDLWELEPDANWTFSYLRDKIAKAYETQYKRQGKLNSQLSVTEQKEFCRMSISATGLLARSQYENEFYVPTKNSIIRVARTIADFYGMEEISTEAMRLALALYGKLPNGLTTDGIFPKG